MMKNVLFVLTSRDTLGDTGKPTGSWLEELASPYYTLTDAGHAVTLASIQAGRAPIDPMSLQAPWITEAGRRFQADAAAQAKLRATPALAMVRSSDFDAVYLIGGTGTVWDFPQNHALGGILADISARKGIVAAVCHGVAGLLNPVNGKPFAAGRELTAISNAEDEMGGFDKIVPFLPETALAATGATVKVGAPFEANVVQDGRLITGQNPASAGLVAQRMLAMFG
jgi:putative intracellular protease/amidase